MWEVYSREFNKTFNCRIAFRSVVAVKEVSHLTISEWREKKVHFGYFWYKDAVIRYRI